MENGKKRRSIIVPATVMVIIAGLDFAAGVAVGSQFSKPAMSAQTDPTTDEMTRLMEEIMPKNGHQTKIVLGDTVMKLEAKGVIDKEKFKSLYRERGGMPKDIEAILDRPSNTPIVLTQDNAQFMVNVLWGLGLANKNSTLAESEAAKPENLTRLASTGGWTLGANPDGSSYYNKETIIPLTPGQDALVKKIAGQIYRPCCNNPTSFPDCNHGMALLGMLQLGVTQGLSEDELYREAMKFNSAWYPNNTFKTALAFKYFQNLAWKDVDPKIALGPAYSGGEGYQKNVVEKLSEIQGLIPQTPGSGSCSA